MPVPSGPPPISTITSPGLTASGPCLLIAAIAVALAR